MGARISQHLRRDAVTILRGALAGCSPERLLSSQLRFDAGSLVGPDFRIQLEPKEKVFVLAVGKASASMARGILSILSAERVDGLMVIPLGSESVAGPLKMLHGDHPVPNADSFRAGRRLLRWTSSVGAGRHVIHLISGGASSMAAVPLSPLLGTIEKSLLHRLLVGCGLGIREVNVVRKHFSGIKGGRLLARAPRAHHLTLLLSDVPRECPDAVGGGPTLPDPSTWDECLELLRKSGLISQLPDRLGGRLQRERWPETPKPGDPNFSGQLWRVVGDSDSLLEEAARRARQLGYETRTLQGSVEDSPEPFLDRLFQTRDRWVGSKNRPRCLLAAGEVRVRCPLGQGQGGRAQDLAVAAALRMRGMRGCLFLAAGSDGVDGNSPAAGSLADPNTIARARRRGLDPEVLRARGDTHRLFRRLGDCVVTGPTGNNLRDLYLFLEIARE